MQEENRKIDFRSKIRKFKKTRSLNNFQLEKSFLSSQKEITRLPTLSPAILGVYLIRKGFERVAKILFKQSVDGGSFIFLMCCKEGIEMLENDLKFSKEEIEHLKTLYKDIYLYRKKYCDNFDEEEEKPFY